MNTFKSIESLALETEYYSISYFFIFYHIHYANKYSNIALCFYITVFSLLTGEDRKFINELKCISSSGNSNYLLVISFVIFIINFNE